MQAFDPVLLCSDCEVVRTFRSRHCNFCNRCVERFDHHCPWVNNCVGFYTQKHFILFLIYVFNGSGHALYLLCKNAIYCLDKNCAIFNSFFNMILSKIFYKLINFYFSWSCNIFSFTILLICKYYVL